VRGQQETHPDRLFGECSVYCELVSVAEQLPWVLETAMRAALARGGVAVVVVPGEVFLADAPIGQSPNPIRATAPVVRPDEASLDRPVRRRIRAHRAGQDQPARP
jgi:pyruvate dehydrogenase (quinone)